MKTILLFLFAFSLSFNSSGQPVVNRANTILTVSDSRLQAERNLFTPRYNDTTAANILKGIDSSGAIIYTRDFKTLWIREHGPKLWKRVGGDFTANSGLTKSTATNVQLGATAVGANSPLLQNTWINTNTFTLNIVGANTADAPLSVWNTSASGIYGIHSEVDGNTTYGIYSQTNGSSSPTFVGIATGGGYIFDGTLHHNSSNTVRVGAFWTRQNSGGVGANGIGIAHDFFVETTVSAQSFANRITSKWTDATHASRTSQFIISGVNSTTTVDIISFEGNKRTVLYGRLEQQQGADVASAAGAIAVGLDGNSFEITGTDAITLISNLNWVNGSIIHLIFTSTASLANGTATSGTDITILLAGATTFTGSSNDVITLLLGEVGGTQAWREVSRSVN